MQPENRVQRARQIVHRILYITIASASHEGKPWNSPVYSSFDDNGNFYWISSPESQHSRNVEANGEAFLVIYDSTVPEGTGEGVYVEATVHVLDDPEDIVTARRNLSRRVNNHEMEEHLERLIGAGVIRAYRATPKRVWMNDDEQDEHGEYLRDIRVEMPLSTLRNLTSW